MCGHEGQIFYLRHMISNPWSF